MPAVIKSLSKEKKDTVCTPFAIWVLLAWILWDNKEKYQPLFKMYPVTAPADAPTVVPI